MILENTNYPISNEQINDSNLILLSNNNKTIDRETLTKIMNTLTNQQNGVKTQLKF